MRFWYLLVLVAIMLRRTNTDRLYGIMVSAFILRQHRLSAIGAAGTYFNTYVMYSWYQSPANLHSLPLHKIREKRVEESI